MQSAFLLVLGSLLIVAGCILAARPSITGWIAENQNKKTAQWLADHGCRKALDDFPNDVKRMKVFNPVGCIVVGLGFCLFEVSR